MPGLPTRPPGAWVRAQLYVQGDQKEWSMDFWYVCTTGAVPVLDQQAVADDLGTHLSTMFVDVLSNEVKIRGAYVEFSDGATTLGWDSYAEFTGTVTESPVPFDVAVVVQRIGHQVGRSAHGRIYVAGIPETFVDGSYLDPVAGEVPFGTLAAALQADFTSGGATLSSGHYSPTLNTLTKTLTWNQISLLGTRRRRRGPF